MLRFLTDFKSGLFPACCLLLAIASNAHAVPITLTSNVDVIFYHGRVQMTPAMSSASYATT